jgi:hypothetical protein
MFQRIKHGWQLTKKSWAVIREHPSLAKLPLIGGLLALATALVLVVPGLFLINAQADAARAVGFVLIAVGSFTASFIVIYHNVILAAAANDALQGREPDIGAARAVARRRAPTIAAWALVSAIVSIAFTILRDRGGTIGRIAASLGSAVWSLVTFLVIPVVALEGIGPIEAIKRSTNLTKRRWGQQVTGNIVIGGISTVVTIIGVVLAAGGIFLILGGGAAAIIGGILAVVGLGIAVAGAVFGGATKGVFGVALYHFAAEDQAIGPFSNHDLASAASPR